MSRPLLTGWTGIEKDGNRFWIKQHSGAPGSIDSGQDASQTHVSRGVSRTDGAPERAYRVIDVAFDGFGKIIRAQACHHSQMQFAANGIKELRGDAIGIVCADATLLSPEAKVTGYPS